MELSVKQPYSLYRWNSDGSSDSSSSSSFSDDVFAFFEESPASSCSSNEFPDEEEEESSGDQEEKRKFWGTQNELLQATLYRTSSLETKIRRDTKEALIEIEKVRLSCVCREESDGSCRNCLRREVSVRLQSQGHNCAICKSKWKASGNGNEILPGEHNYLEVVENTKRGEVRIIIELNFKAEFTMARASEDYNDLIGRLPEVFVGRADRLKSLIKILCSAAKACMKEKKIHLAPWRKHKYMQSKWLGKCERFVPAATAALPAGHSRRRPERARASMLTYDLLENRDLGGGMHLTAVKVV
ncbi:hypothetical protein LINPERPRIM_LOCUS42477 [Linum perenne]